jgi:hypothetical protein
MAVASWETIWHRVTLAASGQLTAEECERMIGEKMTAAEQSTKAMLSGESAEQMLAPYHHHATQNARRLRGDGDAG